MSLPSESDRVELVHTDDPHTSLLPSDRGTVTGLGETPDGTRQLWVDWDDGSSLALLVGVDKFRTIDEKS